MTKQRSMDHYLGVGYFVHPVPLSAVLLLVVNDHYLKYQFPSLLTGKLSDFTGVFFLPLFLCALLNLTLNLPAKGKDLHWLTPRQLFWAIAVTDAVFVGVKVLPPVRSTYLALMYSLGFPSKVTVDYGDLMALTMNFATYRFGRRYFS